MVVKYSDITDIISEATGLSYHRVRLVMKECSAVYQDAIQEGKDIDCGVFKIIYTLPKGVIYKNKTVDWDEMEREVYRRTEIDYGDIKVILNQYRNMLVNYVLSGQAVTIKGIGYLYPTELGDGVTDIRYRIAPSLTNTKCGNSEFVVLDNGVMKVKTYNGEQLRLSMSVNLLK